MFPSIFLTFLATLVCCESANILGVFMFPSISHQIVYQPIWKELSLRGHQVTVITPNPLNDPSLTNLTEIGTEFTYDIFKKLNIQATLSKDVNIFQYYLNMYEMMQSLAESELNSTAFKNVISDPNSHFDLILVEAFHPVMYAFGDRFKAPVIGMTSCGITESGHESIGNPNHPLLFPNIILNMSLNNLSLWQKIKISVFNVWSRYCYYNIFLPRIDKMVRKYFGQEMPYLGELERNVSMLFLNVNRLIYLNRPMVPAIVELSQMHIKPTKPLPNDLKKILDEAKEGVIYFSLGSNVKSVNLPESTRKIIIDALSELPYTVLWKWESDHLPGKPKNVIVRKWLPQQDLLAHPNIKAFVTQGGLQSIEEAMSRGVPLVGLPFIADQPMNILKMAQIGIAVELDPTRMTKEDLKNAILEVAQNDKYRAKTKEIQAKLVDQPMTGLEKAVWWSEYVIRHKGANYLRSPLMDISWFNYLLVDVIVALLVGLTIALLVVVKIVQFITRPSEKKLKIK